MADTLLLIADDASVPKAVSDYLEHSGWEVQREVTAANSLEAFNRVRPAVVILDLHPPAGNGLEMLERLRAQGAAVILLTGQGEIATGVRAMQLGAENFITKPADAVHLAAAVARVGEKVRLARQNALLRSGSRGDAAADALSSLGVSPGIKAQIEMLAASDRTTVLLTGESGTGKGRVAHLIHHLSPRAQGPFIEVNCAGPSATFLDSELFGHERGALTDARERKQGLFELADGGTMFLDAIGELPLELQPQLLKVLETNTFRRRGGTRDLTVDVRLIAATHRDLGATTREGRFREDLFYRLSVMPLHIPAVRERAAEDRLALLRRLVADLAVQMPGGPPVASPETLDRLLAAPWPGNVREMRNVLERAMIAARGKTEIAVEHLPADVRQRQVERRYQPLSLTDVERSHIERALRHHSGNRTRAAHELGISRATLINKIKVYGLGENTKKGVEERRQS